MDFYPYAAYLAVAASAVTLAMLAAAGELRGRGAIGAVALFLIAGWCQFFSGSPIVRVVGLGLQSLLAIALIVRWRLSV